jgi:hypothetical protein
MQTPLTAWRPQRVQASSSSSVCSALASCPERCSGPRLVEWIGIADDPGS